MSQMDNQSINFHSFNLSNTSFFYERYTLKYSIPATICLSFAYVVVFIGGILGNILIFLTVRKKTRTVRRLTVIFILNLAAADFLVIFFCLPFTLATNLFPEWIFGATFCKLVSYCQGVSVAASVSTMTFVAIDRYLAISSPLAPAKSTRYYHKAVSFVWFLALSMNIPYISVFELKPIEDGSNIEICVEIWPSVMHDNLYFIIANVLMFYLVPLVLISVSYILIWHKVRQRNIPGEYNDQQSVINSVNNSRLKVAKMVLVVILTFAVSWFPLYFVCGIVKFGGDFYKDENVQTVVHCIIPIAQWMGAANSCINPLVFVYMDRRIQNSVMKTMRRYFSIRCFTGENEINLQNFSSRRNHKSRDHLHNDFNETRT